MNRIIIIGATSGIGREVALRYIEMGWRIGIAGRRINLLEELKNIAPDRIETAVIDVTTEESSSGLSDLIERVGGMDLLLLSTGIGFQNRELSLDIEVNTAKTNVEGFMRMISFAFNYFRSNGGGHIAAISSIAGTKGIGSAPSYSATKRFQTTYLEALEQLSRGEKLNIKFTDIRPGFVSTELINGRNYPMTMSPVSVSHSIVRGLKRKKRTVIIDWRYSLLVSVWSCIPKWLWVRLPVK